MKKLLLNGLEFNQHVCLFFLREGRILTEVSVGNRSYFGTFSPIVHSLLPCFACVSVRCSKTHFSRRRVVVELRACKRTRGYNITYVLLQ